MEGLRIFGLRRGFGLRGFEGLVEGRVCGQRARGKLEARDKHATCSEIALYTAHGTVGDDPLPKTLNPGS